VNEFGHAWEMGPESRSANPENQGPLPAPWAMYQTPPRQSLITAPAYSVESHVSKKRRHSDRGDHRNEQRPEQKPQKVKQTAEHD
jgi:hypothetical protein